MKKNIYVRLKWLYCAVYALLFLSFYVPSYVLEVSVFEYDYVHHYIFEVATFLCSTVAVCAVYMRTVRERTNPLRDAVGFVLPTLMYSVPYYYLYALAYGYDSIEGIIAGVLIGGIEWLVGYGLVIGGYYVMRAVARRAAGRIAILDVPVKRRNDMTSEIRRDYEKRVEVLLTEQLEDERVISPTSAIVNATFIASLVRFGYGLAEEIYTTVGYLVEYVGTYRPEELFTMITGYLALLAELVLATAISGLIRRLILKREAAGTDTGSDADEE
jgi:hypothetical protein